ncbi:MAG TPA: hypothetical protein VM240_10975 [Verrucomicrobiae bacterium]|nr:hypothetical protein [Verrucomicrobiae bacterium]
MQDYAQRAVGGLALIVLHEVDAVGRHWVDLRERLALARKASGIGGLVRDQVDLLAETRARLALDQRERTALVHSWVTDLRSALRVPA